MRQRRRPLLVVPPGPWTSVLQPRSASLAGQPPRPHPPGLSRGLKGRCGAGCSQAVAWAARESGWGARAGVSCGGTGFPLSSEPTSALEREHAHACTYTHASAHTQVVQRPAHMCTHLYARANMHRLLHVCTHANTCDAHAHTQRPACVRCACMHVYSVHACSRAHRCMRVRTGQSMEGMAALELPSCEHVSTRAPLNVWSAPTPDSTAPCPAPAWPRPHPARLCLADRLREGCGPGL